MYHNTTQSIPQGASTVVALNSERFDTDAMHDTVTNNSRVTINTAGLYVVHFHGQLAAAGDYTLVEMFIRKNGTDIIANQTVGTHANATDGPSCSPSCLYKFIVGDYVQGLVYQSNGAAAARNLNASGTGTGQYDAELSAVWVGLG